MNENKFCTKCGAKLQPGQKFCGECGGAAEASDGFLQKNEKENKQQGKGKKIVSWVSGIGMILLLIMLASGALDGMFYELTDGDFGKSNDNVKTVGKSGGQNAEEETVTDLYRYRMATEEVITTELGFTRNDTGIYPSVDDMTFLLSEGNMYMLSLRESSIGKYSFLGAQVGDSIDRKSVV